MALCVIHIQWSDERAFSYGMAYRPYFTLTIFSGMRTGPLRHSSSMTWCTFCAKQFWIHIYLLILANLCRPTHSSSVSFRIACMMMAMVMVYGWGTLKRVQYGRPEGSFGGLDLEPALATPPQSLDVSGKRYTSVRAKWVLWIYMHEKLNNSHMLSASKHETGGVGWYGRMENGDERKWRDKKAFI